MFEDKPNALPLSLDIRKQPSTRAKLKINSSDTHACQTCFTSVTTYFAVTRQEKFLRKKLLKPASLKISHCRCFLISMRRNICWYHACGLSLWSWLILKVDILCCLGAAVSTLGLRSTGKTGGSY